MGPRILALVVATLIGCGPIVYVNEVTRKAADSVERARQAQADKYAPYWWTRATQYLHQARVKAARSDFEGANRFGRLATSAAEQAAIDAVIAEKDPSKRPLELDRVPAAAKDAVAPARDDAAVAPAKDEP